MGQDIGAERAGAPRDGTDPTALDALLAEARRDLLETGTRNRLVHVNRDNRRAKAIEIVNERADDVYELLRVRGRKMRFKAMGRDKDATEAEPDLAPRPDPDEPFNEARYTDDQLETPLGPDAQAKKLLSISRDARTAEEEQGVNILYLAIGFLTWFENKASAVPRQAPLVLVPVELVRDSRTAALDLRARDDDIATNLPLAQRLTGDFGIVLPQIEIEDDEWRPSAYFDAVRDAVSGRPEWSLDADAMQLGFFSFAKFLMHRDLDPANWSGEGLGGSELVERLVADGFAGEEPLFGPDDRLDERLAPADLIHVVDADASQTKVIEEVRAGRNLVVQGPPGTGKSQTITNLIAAAVHDGRTVLFIAEKMAALTVVHERLRKSGLSSICLELHSRSASKKKVLEELGRTLAQGATPPVPPVEPGRLERLRDRLNAHAATLNEALDGVAMTPLEALSRIVRLFGRDVPAPRIDGSALVAVSREGLRELEAHVSRYRAALDRMGDVAVHPFRGTRRLDLQPTDLLRLEDEARDVAKQAAALAATAGPVAKWLETQGACLADVARMEAVLRTLRDAPPAAAALLPAVDAADRVALRDGLRAGLAWTALRSQARRFVPAAWSAEVAPLRAGLASGVGSFFARWGSRYRSASREFATLVAEPLPRTASERLALADRLIEMQGARASYAAHAPRMQAALGPHWRNDDTDFAGVARVVDWLEGLRGAGVALAVARMSEILAEPDRPGGLVAHFEATSLDLRKAAAALRERLDLDVDAETTDFAELERMAEAVAANRDAYACWVERERAREALEAAGLAALRERIDVGMDEAAALDELRYARAEAAWERARAMRPQLDELAGADRHELARAFAQGERERMGDVQRLVASQHLRALPTGGVGEMGIIRGELARKRGHKPVRKLVTQAGGAMQRLKPVFLMSPISLAQFVPPDGLRFDLLVIDEASQVKPADALGAVARCDQVVVVGDRKQLPPTAFFDRLTGNDADDDGDGGAVKLGELESILTLCEARNVSSRMLEWHYRSRDPSLIAVSNAEFYGSNLVLPPSPLQNDADYGLRFVPVRGAYTTVSRGDGRPGTNKIEAEALAAALAAHARDAPDLSVGIVTFSTRQRDMVTEVLEVARRDDRVLDAFLREGRHEDVFVKNIENVQGDERDVILISVGYGPLEPGGRLPSMSFGPVNSEGGERRLNVLFSRARVRCDVFCSFDPGDIDLARSKSDGVRVFKRFLDFAKTGRMDQAIASGEMADSPFEEDVADVIRSLGHTVDHQVGSAGFRIDLAVRHPERPGLYTLAVECDGATYHSALWARERDRLRQDVLEHLGWRFHRIWSTDWFHRRAAEIGRLRAALDAAAQAATDGIDLHGANAGFPRLEEGEGVAETGTETPVDVAGEPSAIDIPEPASISVPYRVANVRISSTFEPHEAPPGELADIARRIVRTEGPVHEEEVARRLASAFGKDRAGSRILTATRKALRLAGTAGSSSGEPAELEHEGPFWFTSAQRDDPPIRDRSALAATLGAASVRAAMLPPMEIAAAARRVTAENGAVERVELVSAIVRAFGFSRTGASLREAIARSIPADLPLTDAVRQ